MNADAYDVEEEGSIVAQWIDQSVNDWRMESKGFGSKTYGIRCAGSVGIRSA